jgi:hypothetical protein
VSIFVKVLEEPGHGVSMEFAKPKCVYGIAFALICCACKAVQSEDSPVTYRNAAPIGTWHTPPEASDTGAGEAPAFAPAGAGGSVASGAGGFGAQPDMPGGSQTGSMSAGGAGMPGSGGMNSQQGASGSGGMPGGMQGMDMNMMGMDMGNGTGGTGATSATLALTFDVMTVDQGGRYAPRNVGAIWIETQANAFVKTLEVWARTRGRYLTRFNSEAGGSRVDAVTGATLRAYGMHHVTWDFTDESGSVVPPGDYKIVIEVTDHDGAGKSADVPFTFSNEPMMLSPADQQYYTGMQIVVQ